VELLPHAPRTARIVDEVVVVGEVSEVRAAVEEVEEVRKSEVAAVEEEVVICIEEEVLVSHIAQIPLHYTSAINSKQVLKGQFVQGRFGEISLTFEGSSSIQNSFALGLDVVKTNSPFSLLLSLKAI
jgi:hypothetical protein